MSQICLIPHAQIKYSRDIIYKTLSILLEEREINEIWIIPTDHYGRNRNGSSFIEKTEEDMYKKNNKKQEHSALLIKKIVKEIRPDFNHIKFKMIRNDTNNGEIKNNILNICKDFLKNSKNFILFTTDLSHEEHKTTYDILMKEQLLIEKIGKNEEIKMGDINSLSACGKYNLFLFLKLCKELQLFYEITGYNNSKNMNFYWTNEVHNYIVFYIGIIGSKEDSNIKNIGFYIQFLCAYSRSLLIDSTIKIPKYQFNINNPIFITISYEKETSKPAQISEPGSAQISKPANSQISNQTQTSKPVNQETMACRGNFDNSNIIKKVKKISIKDLKEDNRSRWGGNLENNHSIYKDPNFKIEITILEKKVNWREMKSPKREPYFGYGISISDIENITGIFLPSVWNDNPDWTIEKYIEELKGKGGITTDNFRIYQYYAVCIDHSKPIENIQYLETIILSNNQFIMKNGTKINIPISLSKDNIYQMNHIIQNVNNINRRFDLQ